MPSPNEHHAPAGCANPSVGEEEAATHSVQDVMITTPKTLPVEATAAEARTVFTNPKVLSVPLLAGSSFAGLLDREDLPETVPPQAPVRELARPGVPTIAPERPMQEALDLMAATETLRLVVLAEDGHTFCGLLALNHHRNGFCLGS